MSAIQKIVLEFLRHGPAHNQLLSPLTDYLGICGNNGAGTVHVPYEQQDFLPKLRELRYRDTDAEAKLRRQEVLDKTAKEMADILAAVPGFVSVLDNAARASSTLTHLELVLSAAELALLPFELAKMSANSVGGEGNWLSLQTLAPVCITRRVRSVSGDTLQWPRQPRILFITAAPRGMTVPVKQHTQALFKAIRPWLQPYNPEDASDIAQKVGKILSILPNATMEMVEAACAETAYTHVHVLAHGIAIKNIPGAPFGLAMHSRHSPDQIDVVSGSRLATALRPLRQDTSGLPAMVTVASCDSGQVHSVVHNSGASLAHDLHQSGIPLVVASQFPLSFAGSIRMVETLYERLLWGEDPRILLHQLRNKLYALHATDTHDWASLVAYAALPENFDFQLKDVQYVQSKKAIDIAFEHLDKAIDDGKENNLPHRFAQVDEAAGRMPTTGEFETEGTGMLASTEKRKAESFYRTADNSKDSKRQAEYRGECVACLIKALRLYRQAVQENMGESGAVIYRKRSLHWVMGQYLSLCTVLGEELFLNHWGAAKVSAEFDRYAADRETRAWAHGSLAELYLLLLAHEEQGTLITHEDARKETLAHIRELMAIADYDSFVIHSTRRQFQRYTKWWGEARFEEVLEKAVPNLKRDWAALLKLADEVVQLLP